MTKKIKALEKRLIIMKNKLKQNLNKNYITF